MARPSPLPPMPRLLSVTFSSSPGPLGLVLAPILTTASPRPPLGCRVVGFEPEQSSTMSLAELHQVPIGASVESVDGLCVKALPFSDIKHLLDKGGREGGLTIAFRCGAGARPLDNCESLRRTPAGSPPAKRRTPSSPPRSGCCVAVAVAVVAAGASSPNPNPAAAHRGGGCHATPKVGRDLLSNVGGRAHAGRDSRAFLRRTSPLFSDAVRRGPPPVVLQREGPPPPRGNTTPGTTADPDPAAVAAHTHTPNEPPPKDAKRLRASPSLAASLPPSPSSFVFVPADELLSPYDDYLPSSPLSSFARRCPDVVVVAPPPASFALLPPLLATPLC